MKMINELSENLSNLIAAGEVVERPMNVVKELVENSIDAGSTTIKVELTDSGLTSISVLDNGEGINQSQLPIALKRHATSKIKNEDDLFKIASLGFRGEALPSIASVSEFRLTSNDGETNYFIKAKAGKIVEEGLANLPKGTQVEVNNLFFNTPARYRNLGNTYQELSAITDYLYKVSISNPQISFSLYNNKKQLYKTSGNNDLLEVISEAYGTQTAKLMIPFKNQNNLYRISGYTTNNEIFKSNRNALIILVNGRVIKNLNIQYAITDAYQTILPVGKYPVTIININCNYDLIDVNVHPSKLEIRFTDESELRALITKTIKNVIHDSELLKFQKKEALFNEPEMVNYTQNEISNAPTRVMEENSLKYEVSENNDEDEENDWLDMFDEEETEEKDIEIVEDEKPTIEQITINEIKPERHFFQDLQYLGQYHKTYLLFEDETTLYLIDQHAAMERCKYEEISKKFQEESNECYDLLIPITLEYTRSEINSLMNLKDEIGKIGITYDDFGGNTIIVRTIPTWIPSDLQVEFISDIFNHYMNFTKANKHIMYESLAKSLSCKKSIKANMNITKEEIDTLLKNLDKCVMPYTCPHGRPTLIKFTNTEIEKLFKRINQ